MRVGKLSGAVGTYAATDPELERIACERLGLEPAPTSTQIIQRDRHAELLAALAVLASSLDTFALEIRHLARTEVAEVAGAVRRGPEGLVRDAAQAQPGRGRAHLRPCARRPRRRGRRARERGALARARHLALLRRARHHPRRVPRARLHARPLHLARRRPRRAPRADARNLEASHGLFFSQRVLLALVETGMARDERTGSCSATRCARGTRSRLPRRSSMPTPRSARLGSTSTRFRPRAYTRHVDTVFDRLHALDRQGGTRPCLRPRTSTGKVREIYALDDDRLLLVASDRISAFDVVLPDGIPDKGRVLTGLSGFWFARSPSIVPNHMLALRDDGRSMRVPPARDAADRVRRARLSRRSGWKDYQSEGRACAGHRLRRACANRSGCPSRSSRRRRRRRRATTRTSAASRRPSWSAPSASPRSSASSSRSTCAAEHALERGIIIADTKFESGSMRTATLVLADEALTPDSSRFWPADDYEPGRTAALRQAVRAGLLETSAGTRAPGPGAARRRRRRDAREVRRGLRATDGRPLRPLPRRSLGSGTR